MSFLAQLSVSESRSTTGALRTSPNKSSQAKATLLAVAVAGALAGCAARGPAYGPPQALLQEQWSANAVVGSISLTRDHAVIDWWDRFEDPVLRTLLLQAQAGNLDLKAAAARIDQAQAELDLARGGRWPILQASAGVTYTRPDTASQLQGRSEGSSAGQLTLLGSWEPDFWGKARRGVAAEEADRLASIAAWYAARVSLDASVASTYFSFRTLQKRLVVAENNLAQQAENLRIAEARYRAGATSELDLQQARSQYQQTDSQVPTLRASLLQTAHALSILTGEPPTALHERIAHSLAAPLAPGVLPLGIPHDLLRRRPDVRQAEYVVAAQSARVGQAIAALYPSLTLSGSFGAQSTDAGGGSLSDIFSWTDTVESLSAGLLVPILDGGRLRAQVRVQDTLFEQAVLEYQTQVLQAQQEVEDALARIEGGIEAQQSLERARDAALRTSDLALLRYKSGDSDYTTVTSADQARLQVEDALAQVEGDLLQGWVAAYRALGGGWDGTIDSNPAAAPSPELNSVESSTTATTDASHVKVYK